MNDLKGRAYATVAGTKVGDQVQADGDFMCVREGAVLTVQSDGESLLLPCKHGKHHLSGQLSDCGKFYMGLYPISEAFDGN